MVKATLTTKVILLVFLLLGCRASNDGTSTKNLNFDDTLYETVVLSIDNGDTSTRHYKTFITSTDFNIDTSKFFYTACTHPCKEEKVYKIYFNRQKVNAYCDSMLAAIPLYKNTGDDTIFFERLVYEHIREQAIKNEMDNSIYVDELSILLERFCPFVLNTFISDRPRYIINTLESSRTSKHMYYSIRNKNGDTILLTVKTIIPFEIEPMRK